MHSIWVRFCAILVMLVLAAPIEGFAKGKNHRSHIQVKNDHFKKLRITVTMKNHEQVSKVEMTLPPGQSTFITDNGGRITVRGSDTIRIGNGRKDVAIREVGHHYDGTWHVTISEMQAYTHPGTEWYHKWHEKYYGPQH